MERKYIIIISILAIFLLAILFFPPIRSEGSKECTQDSDCIPTGMCHHGCFSKTPSEFSGIAYPSRDCGTPAPKECACIENMCEISVEYYD